MEQAFDRISEGDRRAFSRIVSEHDIDMFAALSGDYNPIHLHNDYARRTIFKSRIAHGILTAGLISAALSQFPGIIVYLSQSLSFQRPVMPGDNIEAIAEVIEKVRERNELRLQTMCRNQRGELVIAGEARVKVLEPERFGLSGHCGIETNSACEQRKE